MADLPTSVGYMTVTGRLVLGYADSNDAGSRPDMAPGVGTVTFAPDIKTTFPLVSIPDELMIAAASIKCALDADGNIVPPGDGLESDPDNGATPGVTIVAPLQPGILSDTEWTWTATFTPAVGQKWKTFTRTFTGAPGDTLNIASLAPVPANPGTEIAAWQAAVDAAQAPKVPTEGPRVIASQGHSIIGNPDPENDGHANDADNLIEASILTAAVLHSGGRLVYGGNWGISGQTSTQIADRAGTDAAAMKAAGVELCVIMTGANDSNDMGLYRTNLESIVASTRAAGIEPVLLLNNPPGDDTELATNRTRNLLVRRVGLDNHVRVVDIFTPLVDQGTGKPLGWGAAGKQYTLNSIHPNAHGNMLIGKAIADALADTVSSPGYLAATDTFDPTNMITNGFFTNDGANWTVQDLSSTPVGISYEARAGYVGKVAKLTRNVGESGFTNLAQDLPNAGNGWNVGDRLGFSVAVETSGLEGSNAGTDLTFQVRYIGNYGNNVYEKYGPQLRIIGDTAPGAIGRFAYDSTVPPLTDSLAIRVRINGTAAYAETHYVGEIVLRNLTALGVA